MPHYFKVAKDDLRLTGVVVDVNENTGKARSIQRIQVRCDEEQGEEEENQER
jgi:calcineurin-like phosphoesterase